jgi:hypothetical protein
MGKALTLGRVASYLPGFVSEAILKKVLAKTEADENAMYLYTNSSR